MFVLTIGRFVGLLASVPWACFSCKVRCIMVLALDIVLRFWWWSLLFVFPLVGLLGYFYLLRVLIWFGWFSWYWGYRCSLFLYGVIYL